MQVETVPTQSFSTGKVSPSTIQPDDSLGTIIFQASETDATASLGHFFLIGHCVWAWLLATIAGTIAGHMYAKGYAKQVS